MAKLPEHGRSRDEILAQMDTMRSGDANWRDGRVFSLVYFAGDDVLELLYAASRKFFSENGLNPTAFPSLRRMETEILQTVAALFSDDNAVGTLTSGGTESILMAVKTARDWARKERPAVTRPRVLVPSTVHPAFVKAGHYFDVDVVHVPVGADGRADVAATAAAIDDQTIMLVASAPSYPHGLMDPVAAIAALAQERGLLCHVDGCVGGFMLPFAERLGEKIPPWDFRVPGVTSISADLHKYGYAAKGASVILYKSRELRQHQFEVYVDWPGGIWASPSMAGTRPGGPIAAAWAVLQYLGEDGYLRLAKQTLAAARALQAGVRSIEGLHVVGEPEISLFAIGSDTVDLYGLADRLDARGFFLDRQHRPATLHLTVTPAHAPHVERLIAELATATAELRGQPPSSEGTAAMYGMLGSLPDRAMVGGFVRQLLDGFDRT